MIERFKTYCETLEGLSTEELDRSADKLVRAEKRNVALVLAHIAEMSRRKGHLERGYKNLFGYCTRRLHLSEGSVALRIQVANVSRRFPQILVALAENRMSLTVAGLLQHMAEIMEQALDIALDKKDLKRKRARRLQREAKRSGEAPRKKSCPDKISAEEQKANSRYIPSEVRERVHDRAGHQCEFRALNGTRCRSRTALEIEHQRPFALHRSHDERFLRLHCRPHNRLSAERVFGVAFIQEKIDASRRKPSPTGRADSS